MEKFNFEDSIDNSFKGTGYSKKELKQLFLEKFPKNKKTKKNSEEIFTENEIYDILKIHYAKHKTTIMNSDELFTELICESEFDIFEMQYVIDEITKMNSENEKLDILEMQYVNDIQDFILADNTKQIKGI